MSGAIEHGGAIGAAARLYGGAPEAWIDLSTGISPHPVSIPPVPLAAWHRLPDEALVLRARQVAARSYGSGEILPLPVAGTQAAIQLLPHLCPAGAQAAILAPTYGEYARVLANAGLAVEPVASLDVIPAETALAVVVNPNNPTGRQWSAQHLVALHDRLAARGGLLVVDEAFADTQPEESLLPFLTNLPRAVVFRSIGKFFGLAGLRLGFVFAAPEVLEIFATRLGPWSVSGPALHIAATILSRDRKPLAQAIESRRQALAAVLAQAGLSVIGGTALFQLVQHPNAAALHDHLCRHHILVRKFDYAPSWLRFGLPPDAQADETLAQALQRFA